MRITGLRHENIFSSLFIELHKTMKMPQGIREDLRGSGLSTKVELVTKYLLINNYRQNV